MAVFDHQEQEQIDQLKAWWQDNGRTVLFAAGALLAVILGWQGWQQYTRSQNEKAAALFAQVQATVAAKDAKKAAGEAQLLMDQYGGSAYAPRAALLAAKAAHQAGDMAAAKPLLQWALDHADESELKDLARLRLATVLLDEGKHDEALRLLDAPHEAAFDALFADRRGDVLSAQGKRDEARAAYQAAYDKLDPGNRYRQLVEFKLDMAGGRR